MKIPISWLREYVAVEMPLGELAHILTMSGTETTALEDKRWEKVFAGLVTNVRPHPNADRLRLVKVDLGKGREMPEVVCGAPNVTEGQKVAYAEIGAVLVDGKTGKSGAKLRRSKIRGVVSEGMICSELELGLGSNHDGIVTLDPNSEVGSPLSEIIGNPVLDIDVTPNRPDCTSVIGIAREVAALTGATLKMPRAEYEEGMEQAREIIQLEITDPALCPRYVAGVVKGVSVGPSPEWLQERLIAVGERPINNVVDITNYVMLEFGQPLHAFDMDTVTGEKVIVRRSIAGERFVTLDGREHTLTGDELMIANPEAGIGIAGVMGGRESEVTSGTVNVLLEAASFDGGSIRRTANRLGIRSGASIRFERGLRTGMAEHAIRRAMYLILQTAGGIAARGFADNFPGRGAERETVNLSKTSLTRVLGKEFSDKTVEESLASLGFQTEKGQDKGAWHVKVPWWRSDIAIEEDLCEEVARIVGYDSIPTRLLEGEPPVWEPNAFLEMKDSLVNLLVNTGMQEVITYSAISEKKEEAVSEGNDPPVTLRNPVSAQHAIMRTSLRSGLLETVATNSKSASMASVVTFECGNVFCMGTDEIPRETVALAGVFAGRRHGMHWDISERSESHFFDAKGVVEFLIANFGRACAFEREESPFYIPGRTASVKVNGRQVGMVGEVRKEILSAFDVHANTAAMFELSITEFAKAGGEIGPELIKPFPLTPESVRDIALLVDKDVLSGNLTETVCRNRLATSATIFDVYEGRDLSVGKKSVAIRIVFQDPKRTLVSEQVDMEVNSILAALQKNYGAIIRAKE